MRGLKNVLLFELLCLTLIGCAGGPKAASALLLKPAIPNMLHRVEKGQTLWRIARIYGLEVDQLVDLNKIDDLSKLEIGQQLLIPAGRKAQMTFSGTVDEDFSWPIKGKIISGFNQPVNNTINKGINIAPSGTLDVLASRGGKVAFYGGNYLDLGKVVILEHPDEFWTIYARNQEVYVKPGDLIKKGAVIAKAGSAGKNKDVYLHFEIRKGSKPENPFFYLPR